MSNPALHKPHEPIASPPADPSVEVAASSSAIGEAVSVAAVTSNSSSSSSYAPPVDQDVIVVVVVVVVVAQGEAVLGDAVGGAVRGSGVG